MNRETVRRLAFFAHIALHDDECETLAKDLTSLEAFANFLEPLPSEADLFEGAVTLSQLRDDVASASLDREELLDAAPNQDGQTILVPRTVEE